jgi:ABC-type uncharacterized transport system permease subunit
MRDRKTRSRVHAADRTARVAITIGGVGVIVAVLAIGVYLAMVAMPLFRAAEVYTAGDMLRGLPADALTVQVDEYRSVALTVRPDGELELWRLGAIEPFFRTSLVPEGRTLTAWSYAADTGHAALGYDDGTLQIGVVRLTARIVPDAAAPEEARGLAPGEQRVVARDDGSRAVVTREGAQLRVVEAEVELADPTTLEEGEGPIRRIDYRDDGRNRFFVAVREDGTGLHAAVRMIRPLGGGDPTVRLRTTPLELGLKLQGAEPGQLAGALPEWLFVTAAGDQVIAVWPGGEARRYAPTSEGGRAFRLMERVEVAPGAVTWAGKLLGSQTILIGDDSGVISGWFVARQPTSPAPDAKQLVRGASIKVGDAPIVSAGISGRDRSVIVADADGQILVTHMTSAKRVAQMRLPTLAARVALAPKLDGAFVLDQEGNLAAWSMEPGHPEATLKSLFGTVHYEGEAKPEFVYQSSAGSDEVEVKMSLTPLIVGTLKATFFAMLFAAPMGVLAAIYTSEYLDTNVRRVVKPTLELMASLPSVVLGFVAAIIVAPFLRDVLPSLLLAFVLLPVGVILGAHLWQMIPERYIRRVPMAGLPAIALTLLVSGAAALSLGPVIERALFRPTADDVAVLAGHYAPVPVDGWPQWVGRRDSMPPQQERRLRAQGLYFRDGGVVRPDQPAPGTEAAAAMQATIESENLDRASVIRWLDGGVGGPWPGWALVLFGPAAIVAYLLQAKFVRRRLNLWLQQRPAVAPVLELGRAAASIALVIAVAAVGATLLSAAGFDPRDSIFGSYTQRNTLVIALIMGFAVIPIIYTISEDALSSVPNSLRAASLGAGATPWQTATRIVLPVAASGIFSACMIGFGRAVGETMIVLMATGNTPIMELNIFSGMRTLAANIAVELPEAPVGGSHYRVLFLCGLVLFIMTFSINTTAEVVRQRFRRRSAAL